MFRSYSIRASEVDKKWYVVDAAESTVGRVASFVAFILMGKHKATYTPHMDCGDNVIIINAIKAQFSGKKMRDKRYYWHTGYPGGIRETTPVRLLDGKCDRIFREAIKGMLGKNSLGRTRMKNVHIYHDDNHGHDGQKPQQVSVLLKSIVRAS